MSLRLRVEQLAAAQSSTIELRLHLGCGANILQGWLNTDAMPSPDVDYLDCTRRFPFVDDSFHAVFCEHLIEHIEKPQAHSMAQEVFRVMRSNAKFRIVTPSLEGIARLALDPQSADARKYVEFCRRFLGDPSAQISDAVNLAFYGHGHRHVYQVEELGAMLRQVGFVDIQSMTAGVYGDPIFNGVDGHGKIIGEDINAIEAFAIETRKP